MNKMYDEMNMSHDTNFDSHYDLDMKDKDLRSDQGRHFGTGKRRSGKRGTNQERIRWVAVQPEWEDSRPWKPITMMISLNKNKLWNLLDLSVPCSPTRYQQSMWRPFRKHDRTRYIAAADGRTICILKQNDSQLPRVQQVQRRRHARDRWRNQRAEDADHPVRMENKKPRGRGTIPSRCELWQSRCDLWDDPMMSRVPILVAQHLKVISTLL